jgi:hypothetical protein
MTAKQGHCSPCFWSAALPRKQRVTGEQTAVARGPDVRELGAKKHDQGQGVDPHEEHHHHHVPTPRSISARF